MFDDADLEPAHDAAYDADAFRFGQFSIDRWMKNVPGGYLQGTRHGRAPASEVPDLLQREGALRDVYLMDLALFVAAERTGVKVAAGMARLADDEATVTFLASQVLDEARRRPRSWACRPRSATASGSTSCRAPTGASSTRCSRRSTRATSSRG